MATPFLLSVRWARGRYDVYTFDEEEADEAEDEDKNEDVDLGRIEGASPSSDKSGGLRTAASLTSGGKLSPFEFLAFE